MGASNTATVGRDGREATAAPADVRFYSSPRLPLATNPFDIDEAETTAIETDPDLYERVMNRLSRPGDSVPADNLLSGEPAEA